MPKFGIIFAIAMLSSAGLPLLNGFVGEFTIMQGAFEANPIWAAFAVTGVILGAAYLLWLYQRTMLGQVTNGKNLTIPDLTAREVALFVPLIAWSVWIGIYPKPYFDILRQPVAEIVERVRPGYFGGVVQNAAIPVPHPVWNWPSSSRYKFGKLARRPRDRRKTRTLDGGVDRFASVSLPGCAGLRGTLAGQPEEASAGGCRVPPGSRFADEHSPTPSALH